VTKRIENPALIAFTALVLLATATNFGSGYYPGKWMGFGAVSTTILAWEVYKRYGWFAALKLAYVLGHVIWFLVYPENRYKPVKAYDLMALKMFIAESGLKLLLIVAPLMIVKISREELKQLGGRIVCAFAVINLVEVFWEAARVGCKEVNACGGVLLNPSMNATMAACALPFVFKHFPRPMAWMMVALSVSAALLGGTSLGLGFICAYLVLRDPRLLLAAPAILALGLWRFGERELLSNGDRWPMWQFFMKAWANNPIHWWFGSGFGTFGVFSINLQNAAVDNNKYWWVWLHNDWLQCLFETGMTGLTLMVGTFLTGVRNLWLRGERHELHALLLFGMAMFINFPLHVGLSAAFGAWLIVIALHRLKPHNNNQVAIGEFI
jgi:hypothetical protein